MNPYEEVYSSNSKKFDGYNTSIEPIDDVDDEEEQNRAQPANNIQQYFQELAEQAERESKDPFEERGRRVQTIAEREKGTYNERRQKLQLSPGVRYDPFDEGSQTPDIHSVRRTTISVMRETQVLNEKKELEMKLREKAKAGELKIINQEPVKKKRRWDMATPTNLELQHEAQTPVTLTAKDMETPVNRQVWEPTPGHAEPGAVTPPDMSQMSETPRVKVRRRWDETPKTEREAETPGGSGWAETPKVERLEDDSVVVAKAQIQTKKRSRWDETPSGMQTPSMTPSQADYMMTPSMTTPVGVKAMNLQTPTVAQMVPMTPEQMQAQRWEREIDERNRPITDEELDELIPSGYKILPPPDGYVPIRTPARKLTATPTPMAGQTGFKIMSTPDRLGTASLLPDTQPKGADLPLMKPDDLQYFNKLLEDIDEEGLPPEERKERTIMKLLLKIKNGTPPMRKAALRQITDKAREFGAGPLFNQILPLLMSPSLEDQERHLLVKVIDRILYKLDDLVRPYVHKILVVIEPLLIDEDYYARVEGREIISNLAKAAGLATMISTMRPDIDNLDEYVRNTTARAFAVVASALGIPSLLPFLKAVCKSKKSWQARHTGIKIIQQIAILMGCAILPYLKSLVEVIEHGLEDEQQKVRTITALGLAALAEAATPYGIESFDSVLKPLWKGIKMHRGKGLAAFLKAIGYLIPLMDAEYASYYTREVMTTLIREFQSPDEEMKKIVLKVVKQCCATDGVEPQYIKDEVLPPFFKFFWNQRMALDKRNYRQLVDTTVEIANKVGSAEIINRIVDDLKDESEAYRKMVMETIEKIMSNLSAADVDNRLEEQLIDGILYAFQEQTTDDTVMLNGFGTVINTLGKRVKPYLPQICGTILWRLNNKSAKVRQQAADLISKIAIVMKASQEEKLMSHLGQVLFEYLGEEYPEVLGSILGALKAIVNVIGMTKMSPPIKDLLPRLTPILKNRHEKVQENCIELVGRIADRGAEFVSAREWMRICFELLELLKAHKKAIRRAAVNTFGYIAKAIGPHDVLSTLLNNLKVQERQNRVCTTVAIAIVAETCSPFTVLPALMNEYRVPELNVQNGVLKSLSFMFEYIGEMGKDYIYAVAPLLEDALIDRDLVHRQTAMSAVGHMTLGVYGFGCEDALVHLLNHVWPNIFETSPHVIQAFMSAIEGFRVSIGPIRLLYYTLQGLFHPARKVRDVYWRVYNTLYIGAQDALVAGYPKVQNDGKNNYVRHELEYFI
jgi:splicing factor 3B subunit 1